MRQIAASYLDYIKIEKGLSPNTLESYNRDIRDFCDFLETLQITEPNEISHTDLMRYMSALESRGKSNATISRVAASLRSFFGYMYYGRLITTNPALNLQSPKVEKKFPEILTPEEVDKLLSLPDVSKPSGLRDKAMLELLYASGLRVSELVALNLTHVNLQLSFIKSAGSANDRVIPMVKVARDALEQYLETGREHLLKPANKQEEALFLNYAGSRLTRQGFWKLIKHYADEANIEKSITPHTLRHSFATHLIQNGADLKSVQEMMGHVDASSTQMYLELSKSSLKSVYEKAHPRA